MPAEYHTPPGPSQEYELRSLRVQSTIPLPTRCRNNNPWYVLCTVSNRDTTLLICLFLDSNLLCQLPGFELALLALPAAWTVTCPAPSPDLNLLCPLPGLELALPAAASFSDSRIFCLAVFCGPATWFPVGVVRLLPHSYCLDIATFLYLPPLPLPLPPTHTNTPDTSVVSAGW